MSKKKIILLCAGGLLLLLVLTLPLWIDGAAHAAVERAATSSLGVETTLGDIDVGIFGGSCELTDLKIRNPDGWKETYFMQLGDARISIALGSLIGGDEIVAEELVLDGLEVNIERQGTRTNYGEIIDHSRKRSKEEPEEGGKRFVIERVLVKNVTVRYRLGAAGLGLGAPVSISEFEMKDVGREGGGLQLGDMIGLLIQAVIENIGKLGTETLPGLVGDAVGAVKKGVGDLFK